MQNQAKEESIFVEGDIHDVVVYQLKKYHDGRGWLAEIFRLDEIAEEFYPQMAYISMTEPGVLRGPHEHIEQADLFCFIGPSNFKLTIWDMRDGSPSKRHQMSITAGEDDPQAVIVPKGLVHAYKNIGNDKGIVINCPNRLYMGAGKKDEIDEIRHEDDANTIFKFS